MNWIHKETLLHTAFGGCIKAESLSIGDVLLNGKGKPVTVKRIDKNYMDIFPIIQKKGINFWISSQGSLLLKKYSKIQPKQLSMFSPHDLMENINITVEEIKNTQEEYFTWKLDGVRYDKRSIELDPYFLGLWLGDGASTQPKIYNIDREIVEWLEEYANSLSMPSVYNAKRIYFYISRRNGERINHITDCLKRCNVFNNKHIPNNYLYNTYNIRARLLAGIIDSDGHYNSDSNAFVITMTRERLVKNIHQLAQGLGLYSSYKQCTTSMLRSDGTYYEGIGYKVIISGDLTSIPTKMRKKQARQRISTKNYLCSKWEINFQEHKKDLCYRLEFEEDNDTLLLEDLTVIKA